MVDVTGTECTLLCAAGHLENFPSCFEHEGNKDFKSLLHRTLTGQFSLTLNLLHGMVVVALLE